MRAGVLGHIELVEFAQVEHLPGVGEIVHADHPFTEVAGGGGAAVVQMARMLGTATMVTALGDDTDGDDAVRRLEAEHVAVHAERRAGRPTRRALTLLDDHGERTIVTLGERLAPTGAQPVLAELDAVFVSAGDPVAIRAARAATVVVATPRAMPALAEAGIELDALVASATDPGEQIDLAVFGDHPPRLVARTRGEHGGEWQASDGATGTWDPVAPPADPVDAFGCGDTFVASLTVALGAGRPREEALHFAASMAVICLTGRGPYGVRLPRAQL